MAVGFGLFVNSAITTVWLLDVIYLIIKKRFMKCLFENKNRSGKTSVI